MDKLLAKIESADITISRGCLMVGMTVHYENGFHQGIMGQVLDEYNKEKKTREGTAYGCEMIRRLLKTFGAQNLKDIEGRHLWVFVDQEGLSQKVLGIEPLRVDKTEKPEPFIFSEVWEAFGNG